MAFSLKREDLKHVPWFSLTEWYDVYNQIYSNNHEEQEKGYKTLLVWKARNPKLPVGVDCTLSLIQVSLRDREWSEKLDKAKLPIYYENDLCMMYSISVMRFLNHISNIGHTKQTSLFQIAKQLKIPEWIVNLRHDAAHGYDLPSIGVMRIAVNILLTWLHDEYWTAEIKNMIDYYNKEAEIVETNESEELQALEDLIELWTATGLYIHAKYSFVSDLPDQQLRKTLFDLRTFTLQESQQNTAIFMNEETEFITENLQNNKEYRLSTAQRILLSEISKCLSKNKFHLNNAETICSSLCGNEVFLPSSDFLQIFTEESSEANDDLPLNFIKFWQGFILLLQEKRLLERLFSQLLKLVNNDKEDKHKRHVASLWLRSIVDALIIYNITQQFRLEKDQDSDCKKKKLTLKSFSLKVRNKVENRFPELKSPWLNSAVDIPFSAIDMNLLQQIFLYPNEFSLKFAPSLLDLIMPRESSSVQEDLLSLMNIQTMGPVDKVSALKDNPVYTVEHLTDFIMKQKEGNKLESVAVVNLSDQNIRNSNWQLASGTENWSSCPFGLLPWQVDREDTVKPLIITPSKICTGPQSSKILPGVIDRKNLKMRSEINWNTVLRGKRAKNKKRKGHSDILIDRAIKVIRQKL